MHRKDLLKKGYKSKGYFLTEGIAKEIASLYDKAEISKDPKGWEVYAKE